jgi:hypothetical protein
VSGRRPTITSTGQRNSRRPISQPWSRRCRLAPR